MLRQPAASPPASPPAPTRPCTHRPPAHLEVVVHQEGGVERASRQVGGHKALGGGVQARQRRRRLLDVLERGVLGHLRVARECVCGVQIVGLGVVWVQAREESRGRTQACSAPPQQASSHGAHLHAVDGGRLPAVKVQDGDLARADVGRLRRRLVQRQPAQLEQGGRKLVARHVPPLLKQVVQAQAAGGSGCR